MSRLRELEARAKWIVEQLVDDGFTSAEGSVILLLGAVRSLRAATHPKTCRPIETVLINTMEALCEAGGIE